MPQVRQGLRRGRRAGGGLPSALCVLVLTGQRLILAGTSRVLVPEHPA
jgi:hypothetical protein